MNPWEIFGWVAAMSASVVVAALAIAVAIALFKPQSGGQSIFRGRSDR